MKRKNAAGYYPGYARWDRAVGLDRHTGNLAAHHPGWVNPLTPEETVAALRETAEQYIEGFKTNPSCPALGWFGDLLVEAEELLGVPREIVEELGSRGTSVWEFWRQRRGQPDSQGA